MSIVQWKANCPGPEQLRKGGKWEEKPVEQHKDHFLHSNRNTAGEKEARKKTAESSQEPGSAGDTLLLGPLCSFRFWKPTPDLSGPLRQLSWPMSKFPRLRFQLPRSKSKLPWSADHLSTFIFKLPWPMFKIPHRMYQQHWSTVPMNRACTITSSPQGGKHTPPLPNPTATPLRTCQTKRHSSHLAPTTAPTHMTTSMMPTHS